METLFPYDKDFTFPDIQGVGTKKALAWMEENKAFFIWNVMVVCEGVNITLPQTREVIAGNAVAQLDETDAKKVFQFSEGVNRLISMIQNGEYGLNAATLCELHSHVGKEEALVWGDFRSEQVHVGTYTPPKALLLDYIAEDGFSKLNAVKNVYSQSINTFLFGSYSQFFFDCNKRTGTLMANGNLIANGHLPLFIKVSETKAFIKALLTFYHEKNATPMLELFARELERNQDNTHRVEGEIT